VQLEGNTSMLAKNKTKSAFISTFISKQQKSHILRVREGKVNDHTSQKTQASLGYQL